MWKRPFKIWVVGITLLSACGRLSSASAVSVCSIAVRIAIPALLTRKFSASATGSVSRSNVAFEHVSLSLDGNHPASVISGNFDTGDRNAKSSTILNSSSPLSVNASGAHVYLDLGVSY